MEELTNGNPTRCSYTMKTFMTAQYLKIGKEEMQQNKKKKQNEIENCSASVLLFYRLPYRE